eukprot:TRINITY_DN11008_c0_g1_i1.p1 TRINITY_DN11008_c0_g1~~TRINITY_DN11008_c0_g1_i1.p1  ORF type:complete len:161 (-),score=18.52 TRINITY_DN11008_c0_g1_i1:286-768(-)
MERAMPSVDAGNPFLEQGDTIYMTAADSEGMMIGLIQSNYGGMGCGLSPPGMGFALQNRGALYDLDSSVYNSYQPNKRPFHTIIPAFVTKDGRPLMSFGVMGGTVQPQAHAQMICDMVDFGLNVQESGDAARYYHDGSSQPTATVMNDGGTSGIRVRYLP